ncbi:MAG: HD domain-containing protein [Candidatus Micrarchaeota archaeon]|nr:HD domain-containing protein [Candidatus Micrarchaeota archaeon]
MDILSRHSAGHDWEHTQRVYRICIHIGKIEGADMKVLRIAAILHDIGRLAEDESKGKIRHEEEGAKIAEDILKRYGFDNDFIERVSHCIKSHRFRNSIKPKTLEAKVLFDSDKLDSIGAIGIGRAFMFAGKVGARLHNSDVDIEKTKPYTKEDTVYREFMVKLRKIKDMMMTDEGKRIAKERHDFMAGFFSRLDKEIAGDL